MWNQLDEKKRQLVAIVAAVAILYMAYRFSFSHAIEAYQLHSKLKKEASLQHSDAAYPHLNKKYLFYQKVLAAYGVKKEEVDTKLWQTVSNIAVGQGVKIGYDPSTVPVDTAASQNIYAQQFNFKGNYFQLVGLLDSLSKTTQIGRINQLQLTMPKEQAIRPEKRMLEMNVTLKAIDQ